MPRIKIRLIAFQIILLCLLIPFSSFGTNTSKIDSLLNLQTSSPESKLDRYLSLSYYYKKRDLNTFHSYLDSASTIVDSVSNKNLISSFYNVYGHYYKRLEKFDSSLIMYGKSITYLDTINEKFKTGKVYLNIGGIFSHIDQYRAESY